MRSSSSSTHTRPRAPPVNAQSFARPTDSAALQKEKREISVTLLSFNECLRSIYNVGRSRTYCGRCPLQGLLSLAVKGRICCYALRLVSRLCTITNVGNLVYKLPWAHRINEYAEQTSLLSRPIQVHSGVEWAGCQIHVTVLAFQMVRLVSPSLSSTELSFDKYI